jgi:transposase
MRFISSLTQQEITWLQNHIRTSANHRERMRAQAILWSHKGYKLKTIADLCEVDRDTVSRWFSHWEQDKQTSLSDAARSGRPAHLQQEEKKVY